LVARVERSLRKRLNTNVKPHLLRCAAHARNEDEFMASAARLLLELKGKLGADLALPASVASDAQADILQALVALGYSDREAALALKSLPADVGVSDGIKLALKSLAK
ncbi:MAG: hypothetical protein H7Y33_07380, partial [Cytophagales bacterium]|nr:hypothetical protein [Rhizobacter sp.]